MLRASMFIRRERLQRSNAGGGNASLNGKATLNLKIPFFERSQVRGILTYRPPSKTTSTNGPFPSHLFPLPRYGSSPAPLKPHAHGATA